MCCHYSKDESSNQEVKLHKQKKKQEVTDPNVLDKCLVLVQTETVDENLKVCTTQVVKIHIV